MGLEIDVTTDIPEYILDPWLNLTGSATPSSGSWSDDSITDFQKGSGDNVSVAGGSVVLTPTLSPQVMNNGQSVLSPGTGSDWDLFILTVDSIILNNGTYYLYYSAARSTVLTTARHIGLATSTDGISWTKYSSNPILRSRVESYDYTNAIRAHVIKEGNSWKMWYAGNQATQDVNICYATSNDGINWSKYSSNPVLKNSANDGAWNGIDIRPSSVFKNESGVYWMYMRAVGTSRIGQIGLATSSDGVSWTYNQSNPLYRGNTNGWDKGVIDPGPIERGNGTFRMWLCGRSAGDSRSLGWIRSTDGLSWTDSGSALIEPKANTAYSRQLYLPVLFDHGDHYWIYAKGVDNNLVHSVLLFNITKTMMNGTYSSRLWDVGGTAAITSFAWNSTVPATGELAMGFRWSNLSGQMGSWLSLIDGSGLQGISARFFQYRVAFYAYHDWFPILFDRMVANYTINVTAVDFRVDDGPWVMANGTVLDWTFNASLQDGDYNLSVRAKDSVNDTLVITIPVKVDLYPPTGSILIEEGRFATNSTNVYIELLANDTHLPIEVQLSRQPDFQGATWREPLSTYYGLFGDPEGPVTIYARYRDAVGRISETYNDTIVIDTTPPEGTVLINDGAKYTNSTMVTVSINWTDLTGVTAIMISNDPSFLNAIWMDPREAFGWVIGDAEGVQRVYVRIMDFVGWVTTLSDDIILDLTPPAASLVINQDDEFTTSPEVTLAITLHDVNPVTVKLANVGDPWPVSWRTIDSPTDLPWTLTAGPDGAREVRMLVRDAADNEETVTDDIVLDTTPPDGTLSLNGGDAFSRNLLLRVSLNASDLTSGLDRMRVSNSDDFSNAVWQSVRDTFDWTVSGEDGAKAVFVQLRDRAGLVTTLDSSIILDTTSPSGSFTIEGGAEYLKDPSVNLFLTFTDNYGLAVVRASMEPTFPDSVWIPYTTVLPTYLGDVEGVRTVYIEVRDRAGNAFLASASTILDLTDPMVNVVVNDANETTLVLAILASWSASDNNGIADVAFSDDIMFVNVEWFPLDSLVSATGDRDFTFSGLDGLKTLYVGVRDVAGRFSMASDSIWYVSSRPEGILFLGEGSGWTNSRVITAAAGWRSGSTASHFRVATTVEGLPDSEWVLLSNFTFLMLEGPGGNKTVHAELLGPHNVTSFPFSEEIKLDLNPPVVIIIEPTAGRTSDEGTALNISVSDDQDTAPVVTWRVNGGDWKPPIDAETWVTLKEGKNTIEVRAEDHAGNVGTASWDIVREPGFTVSTGSWLIIIVVAAVVAIVGLWYWRGRKVSEGS